MKLAIVVPCYNEQEVLAETSRRLLLVLQRLKRLNHVSKDSHIYLVDDGSSDDTWQLIEPMTRAHDEIQGIKLSRNYGHQSALLAGLFNADGDAIISIDADLQDDVEVIDEMVSAAKKGADIVYGVRREREFDTPFKRRTALGFYRLMSMLGINIVANHADYRLMSRRVIEHLKQFEEVNLFLRGLVPLLGFKTEKVYYSRTERFAGETKYPLKKMLGFAWDAITSFSVDPLRLNTVIGYITALTSVPLTMWVLAVKYLFDAAIPGWASTVLPLYFLGGIQLIAIGVIGEYLGKMYKEVKRRPRFIVETVAGGYSMLQSVNGKQAIYVSEEEII